VFSDFVAHQIKGYDDHTKVDLQGIYKKALLVLIDEGLCHRGMTADVIELGQKGIDCKGDYKRYVKKRNTRNLLEKIRRILPIFSFIFVVLGFYITYIKKKTNDERKIKANMAQHKKDSILHSRGRK
jgi:preprotein translocase subunit SecG